MDSINNKVSISDIQDGIERRTLEEAELFLKGMSVTSIAKKYNISRVTVHKDLTKVLKVLDNDLAQKVHRKLRENRATIDDEFVRERVLKAYFYLTANNLNTIEIAEKMGTTRHIIYHDLTVHLDQMHKKYPSIVTDEMLANVQRIFTKHSIDNNLKNKGTK